MKFRTHRKFNQLRPITFESDMIKHAEGSALISCGDTKVICTASITEGVPRFLKDSQQGWLTAEYSMLPRATHVRNDRESTRGRQTGRTMEIQRLIGRVMRSCIKLDRMKDKTIVIDCDVIQADGGTRTAAINGAMVALVKAIRQLQYSKQLIDDPLRYLVGAISVGIVKGELLLDLDYKEDSNADADVNIVMNEQGDLIELQASSEKRPIRPEQLDQLLQMAQAGVKEIIDTMKAELA